MCVETNEYSNKVPVQNKSWPQISPTELSVS